MKLKTVKISKEIKGSPDGTSVITYAEGETYDLPEELANSFISTGVADEAKPEESESEEKAKTPAKPAKPSATKTTSTKTAAK